MALPTLTVAVNAFPAGREVTLDKSHVYGTITIGAGGAYQTNGLPLAFSGVEFFESPGALAAPVWVELYSAATGFVYRYDPAHGTIRIYEGGAAVSTPLAELANLASVTADTVQFAATFYREG